MVQAFKGGVMIFKLKRTSSRCEMEVELKTLLDLEILQTKYDGCPIIINMKDRTLELYDTFRE